MQLFTFLGVGRYLPTVYVWQEQVEEASFAPAASARFLNADRVTVFLTHEAKEQVFSDFLKAMPEQVEVVPVSVPLGKNSDELWDIFTIVTDQISPEIPSAFDITHGLRSFPLIGLLVAAFLRASKRVNLHAVLYGAFDVRDQSVTPNRTPMFDLTPLLDLLEWASAADRFTQTGDARYLASLGKREQKALALAAGKDREQLAQAGALGNLAGALTGISQALGLIRPNQSMESIAGLTQRIEAAKPALSRAAPAQPLFMLLEQIDETYAGLGLKNSTDPTSVVANLATQVKMIGWYIEREQWIQAVTLLREWFVSWTMVQLNQTDILDPEARNSVESVLNSESKAWQKCKKQNLPFSTAFLSTLPVVEQILDLWGQVTQTRNDINHAGMRPNPGQPEKLIEKVKDYYTQIQDLPMPPSPHEVN